MRMLVGIPVLTGPVHTREAIESVLDSSDADVLVIDNGSASDMIWMLTELSKKYHTRLIIYRNPVNIYVNPAWNQIIKYFLNWEYDHLVIMNSDLVLNRNWYKALTDHLHKHDLDIPVPIITTNKNDLVFRSQPHYELTEVFEGIPGVFISLTRAQAALVFPIPSEIKVWFGDNWIYDGLRKRGYKTVINSHLVTYHSGSQTVSRVPGIAEIIEEDKKAWENLR